MIHLRLRTEHSYLFAAGTISKVLDSHTTSRAGICDRHGTWGHVKWMKECKKRKVTPIFGVELACVPDMEERERQPTNYVSLIARNNDGLKEIYEATTLATEKFYYIPRLDYGFLGTLSNNIIILSGSEPDWGLLPRKRKNIFIERNQLSSPQIDRYAKDFGYKIVATGDNLYPLASDRGLYEIILGDNRSSRTADAHILEEWEWSRITGGSPQELELALSLSGECDALLPHAKLVHPATDATLLELCLRGAKERGLDWRNISSIYKARLKRELDLISEKKFEDYFFLVADAVRWAKERMFVGPARGSSCGSLVCYLLGITDIDPMPFDLLFERFIDVNREDLPDIDIDFQDTRREMVFDYLRQTYGADNVSRLGTVNVFKAKSALSHAAKELSVPMWEIEDLKKSIIERSSGDMRAQFCVMDTFMELDIGRKTLEKYPQLMVAGEMEGHASHTGMHAAGILVTADPVTNYCSVNRRTGTAMIDKKDAESLDLLKIDALGLRTLSILQDTLDQIGKDVKWLLKYPLDDKKAFQLLTESKFAGIFQFEGYALQSLTKQMPVEMFEDVAVLTALARPGPLSSGGTGEFIKRRKGESVVTYIHPLVVEHTKVTFGVIVYQEQVMQIARLIGNLSWADVSELRKAMSKSLGKEYFDGYYVKFREGAVGKHKLTEEKSREIWDSINTMGSWAFNRSHAIAYGTISYWCLILKAHYPLEFAAACLRNSKDDDQSILILRELVVEGYKYTPFNRYTSRENWSVQNGELVGGLTAIKGVGVKMAAEILSRRDQGLKFTPGQEKKLATGVTPWDSVFECRDLWGHIKESPQDYDIVSALCNTSDITEDSNGEFVWIAQLKEKNQRDHNEQKLIERRGGGRMEGATLYLNLVLQDDTGTLMATVNKFNYEQFGKPLIETCKVGDWFIWKGKNRAGFRRPSIMRWKKLTGNPFYAKKGVDGGKVLDDTITVNKTNTNINMSDLTAKLTRPLNLEFSDEELLAWYNENSGKKTQKTSIGDRAEFITLCQQLEEAINNLSGGKSAKQKGSMKKAEKVAKQTKSSAKKGAKASAAAKPAKAKKEGEGKGQGRVSKFAGKRLFGVKDEGGKYTNTRRAGSFGHKSLQIILDAKGNGIMYEAFVAAGGRSNDLAWDVEHSNVTVKD